MDRACAALFDSRLTGSPGLSNCAIAVDVESRRAQHSSRVFVRGPRTFVSFRVANILRCLRRPSESNRPDTAVPSAGYVGHRCQSLIRLGLGARFQPVFSRTILAFARTATSLWSVGHHGRQPVMACLNWTRKHSWLCAHARKQRASVFSERRANLGLQLATNRAAASRRTQNGPTLSLANACGQRGRTLPRGTRLLAVETVSR